MTKKLATLITLSLLIGSLSYADEERTTPLTAAIMEMASGGSGCTVDSATAVLSEDFRKLQINFPTFTAELGPGISRRHARKNCTVTLSIQHTEGWQYSLSAVDFTLGNTKLEANVSGEVKGKFYFTMGETTDLSHAIKGPIEFYFVRAGVAGPNVWSSCDSPKNLNINGSVKVKLKEPEEVKVSRGSLTLNGPAKFDIQWRRCPERPEGE